MKFDLNRAATTARMILRSTRIRPALRWAIRRAKKTRKRLRRLYGPAFSRLEDKFVLARQLRMLRGLDIEAGTTVWFMVLDSSSWKYTEIYQAFIQDSRFSVYVCVVPNNWHGSERELRAVREVEMLTGSGVTAVLWDANTMSPGSNDIILLLNPHENLYPKGLVRTWMRLCSTIYIPYTFWLAQQWESLVFRTRIHRTAALVLYESKEHLALAQDGQRYAAKNGIAIGYPGFSLPSVGPLAPNQDRLRDKGDRPQIVWAPHHSIDVFSTFLAWHDYMLEVAQRHNSYQVIFRPHPVLLPKLSVLWGKTKLDKYLSAWSNSASGDVSFGPQELLFKRSTAMIHDSLGFMAEYVSTGRPTAYLTDDLIESVNRLNRAGKILLNVTQSFSLSLNLLLGWRMFSPATNGRAMR